MTLTNQITGGQILQVYASSVTAGWASLGPGNATGYQMQVSSMSDYTGLVLSSTTWDVNSTTLTVGGLLSDTTYYLRAED